MTTSKTKEMKETKETKKRVELQKTKTCSSGVELRHWSNGNKTIRITFQYQGVCCRETLNLEPTASNIKYATNLRGEIINAITRGTFNYPHYFPNSKKAKTFGYNSSSATVKELIENYLNQAQRNLQFSTFRSYRLNCYSHLIPTFGSLPIKQLTPAIIRNWITTLKTTAKTLRNVLTPLRNVIEIAITDQIIDSNPLEKVIISRLLDKDRMKSDFKVDPFTRKEINAILEHATGQDKNLLQFAFFTGLRTSELIGLEWNDVDWENNVINISRAVVRKYTKCPKTESGARQVLLLPPALEALKDQKQYTGKQNFRVFHNPRNNVPWETDSQIRKRCWIPIIKEAKVRYRNPYQTRHTYASMMLSNGENIMWLSKQMGHADIEMVMRTYGKWIPDSSIKAGYRPVNNWGMYLEDQKEETKSSDKEPKAIIKTSKNDLLEPLKSNLSA